RLLASCTSAVRLTAQVLVFVQQIQHPTASLIAKVATAQDDITGDGTTSNVLIIGELLKQADLYISEGLHPRIVAEGFEIAKEKALEVLEQVKVTKEMDRETLIDVARTSLRTKVHAELADILTEASAVVDSVLIVRKPDEPIDLHMVEIMEMKHKSETDTTSGLNSSSRTWAKKSVQLLLVRLGVVRTNHRNVRLAQWISWDIKQVLYVFSLRLTLACGGTAMNSVEDLTPDCLGHAGLVYEYTLGEEKYTFIEKCDNPRSVTLLIRGPNKHTLMQIKDAVRDGLRAVKNAIEDGCVVPGAGALEVAVANALVKHKPNVKGRAQLGVQAFADALLIIPKVLAQNSGYDPQETLVKVQTEHAESGQLTGVDLNTGEPMVAAAAGIWDNYNVKKQLLHSCTVIASNILLVDEIMRAGMSSLKG
ncbi:T-complex protein 1 subunit zeta, partial [Tauraco erythrolophus]